MHIKCCNAWLHIRLELPYKRFKDIFYFVCVRNVSCFFFLSIFTFFDKFYGQQKWWTPDRWWNFTCHPLNCVKQFTQLHLSSFEIICLELTSWEGRHLSAHPHSPVLVPLGHHCHCRNPDTHSSPVHLTHTRERGKKKFRWRSWKMMLKGPVQRGNAVHTK